MSETFMQELSEAIGTEDRCVLLHLKQIYEELMQEESEDVQREYRTVIDNYASGPIQQGFIQNYFTWNPNNKSMKRQSRDKEKYSFFNNLHKKFDHDLFWNLVNLSIPMYPSKKYQSIETNQFRASLADHANISMWYLMWHECFGVEVMNYITAKHEQLTAIVFSPHVENKSLTLNNWKEGVDNLLEFLASFHQINDPKTMMNESCKSAKDFLLEPFVLMQLPWNLSLFHQWLVAALTETIVFEKETVEFRHYSIPSRQMTKSISSLLTLVKRLKETLLVGLFILHSSITTSLDATTKYSTNIMDDVIMKSTDMLKFILSGNAQHIVKSMKAHGWPKEDNVHPEVKYSISYNAFTTDHLLESFFHRHCYSFPFWKQDKLRTFFHLRFLPNIDNIVHKIRKNETIHPHFNAEPSNIRLLSLDESSIASHDFVNKQQLTPLQVKEMTVKVIKDVVIGQGHLPFITADEIEDWFDEYEYQKDFDYSESNDLIQICHNSTQAALRYIHIQELLVENEKDKTTIGRMITAHMELLEREQLVRLVWCVSTMTDLLPVAAKVVNYSPLSVGDITFNLLMLEYEIENKSSNKFVLPEKFKQPVTIDDKPVLIEQKMNKILGAFENRIGRIVFNALEHNNIANKRGVGIYKHTNIVLYLLPNFVAMIGKAYEKEKDNKEKSLGLKNKLKIVDGLIKHYETEYMEWSKIRKPKRVATSEKDLGIEALKKRIQACKDISQTLIRLFSALLEDSPQVVAENLPFLSLPSNDDSQNLLFYISNEKLMKLIPGNQDIIHKWSKLSLNFMETLLQVTLDVCDIPKPGCTLTTLNKGVQELYFAGAVLWELEKLHNIREAITPMTNPLKSKLPANRNKCYYDILRATLNCKNIPGDINDFVQQSQDILRDLLGYFKEYRKKKGKWNHEMLVGLPEVNKAVESYISGDLEQFEALLKLSHIKALYVCMCCKKRSKKCVVCLKCVEQNYPEVNSFCSEKCRDTWWHKEHQTEHFEFELGLGKFFE